MIAALLIFGIIYIELLSQFHSQIRIPKAITSNPIENDNDTTKFTEGTVYELDANPINKDKDTGITYVSNVIIIFFENEGSQAVCLPEEYRFTGNEVAANKIGDVVLLMPKDNAWDEFLHSLNLFFRRFLERWA